MLNNIFRRPFFLSMVLISAIEHTADADTVTWLNVSSIPLQADVLIDDPVLGMIQVTTDVPAQGTFGGPAGSLGKLSWGSFSYIAYDSSGGAIDGTMTFNFLDGPIETLVTPIYFSTNGLASISSYTFDNQPVYLGDIGVGDGTGIHTPLDGGLVEIQGFGFNHNPDLFEFNTASITSITVIVDQGTGDGAGFNIGTIAPDVLTGDVNCDGEVNLLDVAPFIDLVSSGVYDIKADINQDGNVDLLDVAPFIDLLSA